MKVHLLCTAVSHPVVKYLQAAKFHTPNISIIHKTNEAVGGDILFLISCSDFINAEIRGRYKKTLVLHASDLPEGRGWSPHVWEIVNGGNVICLSMLEAADQIDAGDIWKKSYIRLEGHELYDEINDFLFNEEIRMINWAIDNFFTVKPEKQAISTTCNLRKRTPEDSRLNTDKSLKENFPLLRVSDPDRFPAFFTYLGHDYKITIEKIKKS